MPQSCTGVHTVRDNPLSADPGWRDTLQAAVQVACHRVLTDPGPCSLAALCLALRRLHDSI